LADYPHAHGDEALATILRREIVDANVASSAAVGVVSHDGIRAAEVLAPDVAYPASFDLASVTKPLTAIAIARAVADGRLSFDTKVGEVMRELAAEPAAERTIGELLSHRAGLPAWGALYRADPWAAKVPTSLPPDEEPALDAILRRAASRVGHVGEEVYSDIGYVLLGAIVERVTGERLADRWRALTGIGDTAAHAHAPPTEDVPWRGVVRGEVHDENAAMIRLAGGSPGHAGAFATVHEVLLFASRVLDSLDRDPIAARLIEPIAGGTHSLGWDLRSSDSPSSGAHFGPRTFGHLGFTGTSVWIDPDARLAVALLTNRTYPTRGNLAIRSARPRVHDAVVTLVKALRKTSS